MPCLRQLSEAGKDYITRSLVPSLVLENRLRTSSSDNSGPLSMTFHGEWRHPDCPVNQWYDRRTGSSTQLVSIQHWRDRKVPYHHEYLLMELADGAMCRLERVGEGSRAAAIGRVGCTAHDIIQHFPPQTYQNTLLAAEPADIIIELDVQGFHLLDILAVCFGVQQYWRSSTYTVQRFDSHFLCITVLTLLARRIANWENRVTQDVWHSMVNRMVQKLQNTSTGAHDFFGLAISAFINTDQPTPRGFVLKSIQSRLGDDGGDGLRDEIASTLWNKDLKQAANDSLSNYVDDAVRHALDDSDPCAARIKQLLGVGEESRPLDDLRLSQFRRTVATQQATALLGSMQTCAASLMAPYAMQAKEHTVPLMVFIRSSLYTSSLSLKALHHFGELWEDLVSPCNPIIKARITMHAVPQVIKMTRIHSIKKFMICDDMGVDPVDDSTRISAMDSVITATYDVIQEHATADDYGVRVLVVAKSWLNQRIWTRCLAVCVSREIEEEINSICMLAQLITIRNAQSGRAEARRMVSVFNFMEGIQRRIQAHAGEMETLGLASATLVQTDIEEAMSEIWRLLPRGFGDGLDNEETASDAQVPPYSLEPTPPENTV